MCAVNFLSVRYFACCRDRLNDLKRKYSCFSIMRKLGVGVDDYMAAIHEFIKRVIIDTYVAFNSVRMRARERRGKVL